MESLSYFYWIVQKNRDNVCSYSFQRDTEVSRGQQIIGLRLY